MGMQYRKSMRLKDFDYASEGEYFITIVTHERKALFGEIKDGKMILNEYGRIVEFAWNGLVKHNLNIELDEFVTMPNHVHGIIAIVGAGPRPASMMNNYDRAGLEPAPTVRLPEIVRQFKTFSAKRINELRGSVGIVVWQRGYYDHIIRSEKDYEAICNYIADNPQNWENDEER